MSQVESLRKRMGELKGNREPKPNYRLQIARDQKLWTQEEAAEKVGVDPQTFWRWENGEQRPRKYALRKLAEVFGMSTVQLGFGRSSDDHAHVAEDLRQNDDLVQAQHPEETTQELVVVSSQKMELTDFAASTLTKPNLLEIGIK